MQGQWGVEVGYNYTPELIISAKKQIADWQLASDCANELCIASRSQIINIYAYPKWGGSPFPQIDGTGACDRFSNISQNVNIENVQIIVPPLVIEQFTVGQLGGPVSGTFTFTPLIVTSSLPLLKGKAISIALGRSGPLTLGLDYVFDITLGTITLLTVSGTQLLFNTGEVYTITIY